MKQILILITLTLFSLQVISQGLDTRTKNQVKTKFLNAKKQYENKDYDGALDKIDEIDEILVGKPLASVQNLKVKALIGNGEFEKAKKELYILEGLNLSDGIIEDIAAYSPKIESGLEVERKRKEKVRQDELDRQKREQDKKLAAQKLENKKKNIAASMLPEVKQVFHLYNNLEEGKPYLVVYRSKLTSNSTERAVFIYYGDKYIIYTIPSTSIADNLNKDNVSFSSYNAGTGSTTISATIKPDYGDKRLVYFKKSIHYSNVYLGGLGDELLWTKGTQYTEFDKTLYYYYFNNTLSSDIELKTSFDEKYFNPYIETGTITKTIDYELVQDSELYSKLKNEGVTNKATSNLDNPKGLEITLVPSNNLKMIYPLKKIKYVLKEKITKYNMSGSKYKGTLLYFTPKTTSSHYGYIQYGKSYPKENLFEAITGLSNNFILKETYFNSIYNSFSENIGNGKSRYFTSSEYNTPYWAISRITDGTEVALESMYGSYKEETSYSSDDEINTEEGEIFTVVETMPEFPGGQSALSKYISNNLNYPESAKINGVSGRVFVSFIINKDGTISDVKIMKSVNEQLDAEAIRVIKSMPNWKPGKQRGEPVRVQYNMPIN